MRARPRRRTTRCIWRSRGPRARWKAMVCCFSSRRRHTRLQGDWSSDVCSSDLIICVEPRLNGCLAGELMGKIVPAGSQVAVVAGMLRTEDHRKKTDGFSEEFPRHSPGGEIVSVIEGHEHEEESYRKTFDMLRRFPTLAGIYVNTVNCLPVCRALGARGLAG